ncbi:hypothetical protein ACMD2_26838 [Ananas comosus]|uniref:Uncharacterized protein n=1 Tax=Ananas comosus TaxID=4615 RepID=A0A199VMP8_ANACO|nr:hypothetical protein ACMD2_26838 [Ananas comosus]
MDVKYKDSCWEILESKFAFPRDPTTREKIRHNTIKKLGDLWRNYKCELKAKYYDESRKRKEILTRAPLSVNRAQFVRLVDYWRSDEAKKKLKKLMQKELDVTQGSSGDSSM